MPLFLPDESSAYSRSVIELAGNQIRLKSPSFSLIEFGNVIATGVRRSRLTSAQAIFAHEQLHELPIEIVDYVSWRNLPRIHDLAIRCNLSFYDALYLAMAMEENARLATLDKDLRLAATAVGVETV